MPVWTCFRLIDLFLSTHVISSLKQNRSQPRQHLYCVMCIPHWHAGWVSETGLRERERDLILSSAWRTCELRPSDLRPKDSTGFITEASKNTHRGHRILRLNQLFFPKHLHGILPMDKKKEVPPIWLYTYENSKSILVHNTGLVWL